MEDWRKETAKKKNIRAGCYMICDNVTRGYRWHGRESQLKSSDVDRPLALEQARPSLAPSFHAAVIYLSGPCPCLCRPGRVGPSQQNNGQAQPAVRVGGLAHEGLERGREGHGGAVEDDVCQDRVAAAREEGRQQVSKRRT